ncbi:MAG: NAD-dependent dihydropyrimidine dehydrogenase subunit PreA [Gemmatimonadetes bacterium]|nr:NAD-dependent dihydropyrimidine dehydrogenase subunit PreA [Gemmatimonadota bacterium]
MPDLTANCAGIVSPNPFWLASAPPSNSGEQVMRAFDAGWGGAVWKTLGQPIQNVSSRFGGHHYRGTRAIGFNNIELITDRPLDTNLREIEEVKKRYPHNALIVSLMVESEEEWKEIIRRSIDAGADGLELNFGCPHGMCERGMGSAVGQEPKVNERITSWAASYSSVPVIVKLTPNVHDIRPHGLAAQRGGADAVSLINTIKSIVSVDIDSMIPAPIVGELGTNGGYCGPAVKPIALQMVASLASTPEFKLPISGIGGISNWRDAVEFMLLGSSSVQVCTEVMLRGYRVVEDMIEGLEFYMREKGFERLDDLIGGAAPAFSEWGDLDMNFESVARVDAETCIGCYDCVVACADGGHQCIEPGRGDRRVPVVDEEECVGCNLCEIVCPVPGCITMTEVDNGWAPATWNQHLASGVRLRPKKGSH